MRKSAHVTSGGVLSFKGTSPLKHISSKVVPKLHLSAAVLRVETFRTHSGEIHGILSTRSGKRWKKVSTAAIYSNYFLYTSYSHILQCFLTGQKTQENHCNESPQKMSLKRSFILKKTKAACTDLST